MEVKGWFSRRWRWQRPFRQVLTRISDELADFRKTLPVHSRFGSVLLEDRPLPYLRTVVANHLYFAPPEFGLTVFCGEDSRGWMRDVLAAFENIHFETLPYALDCYEAINRFMLSRDFYDRIPYEKCLVFQHDTLLCRPMDESFFEFDYIGAPWKAPEPGDPSVGNGGLSWRNIQACSAVLPTGPTLDWEDVHLGRRLPLAGWKVAPVAVAQTFSVEQVYYPTPFGVHNCWSHLPHRKVRRILNAIEHSVPAPVVKSEPSGQRSAA
ncbi:hypothetical protein GC176_15730 [bacterium]|nr:hypothetical protein [bacterium]